jgi:hypothetical protein
MLLDIPPGQNIMLGESHALRYTIATTLILSILAGCAGLERRPPPTLDQVVQMSKDGMPAEEIIRELQDTRAVYPLTGSQIVKLHEDGVPDTVLDYLQYVYADSIRWETRMRYENSFWWHDCFYCYPRPVIVVPR